MIRVAVSGTGHMGREVLAAVYRAPDLEPVGVVEKFSREDYASLPDGAGIVPMASDPAALFARCQPEVVIDFTNAEWTPVVAKAAVNIGARMVIGTTALSQSFIDALAADCQTRGLGCIIAPNFALGAVLMMHLARVAARYYDYAEIMEMHQEKKVDAPSGTSFATAREIVEARGRPFEHNTPDRETLPGARGASYEGVAIHSVRLPGMVAHQEVVFGGVGETLKIRHDSTGRESFVPGVLLATREVMKRRELVIGLDKLLGL
jgi:4-hydroxy-tetrahydrodipicolinate reductase